MDEMHVGCASKFQKANQHKRRWTKEEQQALLNEFGKIITQIRMPSGKELQNLSEKLASRSVAQVRSQIHNYISGKLSIK